MKHLFTTTFRFVTTTFLSFTLALAVTLSCVYFSVALANPVAGFIGRMIAGSAARSAATTGARVAATTVTRKAALQSALGAGLVGVSLGYTTASLAADEDGNIKRKVRYCATPGLPIMVVPDTVETCMNGTMPQEKLIDLTAADPTKVEQ